MELAAQEGASTPTSISISNISNTDRAIPSKLHNWIERYLDQLVLPLGTDCIGDTADARLRWGYVIKADEWSEISAALNDRRVYFHELTRIASKLHSFFYEAVVAVRVISELRHTPDLLPYTNPHRQVILSPTPTNQPLANLIEEIALHARVIRLLDQANRDGELIFSKMIDVEGNSIECIKRTEAVLLSQQMINTFRLESRISLKPAQLDSWIMAGISFP